MQSLKVYLQEKVMDNLPWKSVMHLVMWAGLGIGTFYIGRVALKVTVAVLKFLFS